MQDSSLTQTIRSRQWVYVLIWGVIWWVVIAVGAFLWSAPAVRQLPVSGVTTVQAGPFILAQITKAPGVADSVTLAFTMQYGLILLGLACCALQAIAFILLPALLWRRRDGMMHIKGK